MQFPCPVSHVYTKEEGAASTGPLRGGVVEKFRRFPGVPESGLPPRRLFSAVFDHGAEDLRLFRNQQSPVRMEYVVERLRRCSAGGVPAPGEGGLGLPFDQSPVDCADSVFPEQGEAVAERAARGAGHVFRTDHRPSVGDVPDEIDPFKQFARPVVGVERDKIRILKQEAVQFVKSGLTEARTSLLSGFDVSNVVVGGISQYRQ